MTEIATYITTEGQIQEMMDALEWIAGRLALLRTTGQAHKVNLLGVEEHARDVFEKMKIQQAAQRRSGASTRGG